LAQALAVSPDREELRARALSAAGELAAWSGDVVAARPLIEEAVSLWGEIGGKREAALALLELGWGYFFAGDDASAHRCMQRSFDLQKQHGTPLLINRAQIGLLQVLVSMGEVDTVEPMSREAVKLAETLGDRRSEHLAQHFLADCALIRGDCATADRCYRRSLELALELGDRSEMAIEIQGVAMATAGLGQPARALGLCAAASAELDTLGIDISGVRFWSELLHRYLDQARETLRQEAQAEWEKGQSQRLEWAIHEALSGSAS
jgi:tetratricopeptide (TPR) repeat protein